MGAPNGALLFFFNFVIGLSQKMTKADDFTWIEHELGKYRIEKQRFGTYRSILEDGTPMVTGATEDGVRFCTEEIHMPFYMGSDFSDIKTTEYKQDEVVDL